MSQVEGRSSGLAGPADERPLTEDEYRQLQRLLSDPFSFPVAFKTWLVSYLETSDLNLPMSAISGLTAMLGITGLGGGSLGILPAGLIFPYGGDVAPAGSLLCDGASYPRTTYSRLFTAIGARFGAPDSNTFNVPDLRGRVTAGKGTHADVSSIGESEGIALAARSPRHKHTVSEGEVGWNTEGIVAGTDTNVVLGTAQTFELGRHTHGVTVGPQTGNEPWDTPAYLVVSFIIVS